MNFICDKPSFVKNLTNAVRAILPKTVEGILDSLLLIAENNCIKLTGYNLEFGITNSVEAKVISEGKMIVPAKIFLEIIKKMPEDIISVELDGQKCAVRSGKSEYFIMAGNADDYPELPKVEEKEEIIIEAEKLKSMISQTAFAVAVMDARPVFTGCFFDISDGKINMVSTDGSRIAVRTENIKTDKKNSFVVPGKALAELEKMIEDNTDTVKIELGKEHVIFKMDNSSLISRLLEGDFLNYKQCVPNDYGTKVEISTKEFINTIERTSLIIYDRIKSPVKLEFQKDKISVTCTTSLGKCYDEIPCDLEGKEMEIGFNSRFLLDVMKSSEKDKVILKLNNSTSPMCVTPVDSDEFLFLVLPTRL